MRSAAERLGRGEALRWGVLLSFGAAVGSAMGLVPYKVATERAEPEYVVVALLVAAATLNTVSGIIKALGGRSREAVDSVGGLAEIDVETADPQHTEQPGPDPPGSARLTLGVGLLLGVLAAAANWTASEAVTRLDVSIASLLIQMQVLFAALLARVWLDERVGRRFLAGAVLALVGLAIMQGLDDGEGSGWAAVAWGLMAAACFGAMQVVTRRWISEFQPVLVNALRLWIAALVVALVPGSLRGAWSLPAEVMLLAAAAATCGPFLGRLMMMQSARYVPAATSTLVGLSSPVLALLIGWVLLDELPTWTQVLGGAVVVAGMVAAISGGPRRRRRAMMST